MRSILTSLALAVPVALPLPMLAHDYSVGTLAIGHPVVSETPPMARSAAGYLSITNEGDAVDTLIAIESDLPSATIHRSEVVDGVARMTPVDGLAIPAGETVTLEPGGLHVMFLGLDAPFVAEERIPATLIFEHAGSVDVVFHVKARDAETHHDHGHMPE